MRLQFVYLGSGRYRATHLRAFFTFMNRIMLIIRVYIFSAHYAVLDEFDSPP